MQNFHQLTLEQPKKAPETKAAGNSFEGRVLPRVEGVETSEPRRTERLAVVSVKAPAGGGERDERACQKMAMGKGVHFR